ncbi:MAG TPA: (2Fe-2S) ferredoxin domain-containing protein [Haliangiales bacterium]|nr:(2Fe-2S) ferredoxin domain-containing protein [Haliangiales bacterium]
MKRYRVVVCRGPECGEVCQSSRLHAAFVQEVRRAGLDAHVEVGWQSCFGRCRQAPNVMVSEVRPGERSFLLAVSPVFAGPGGALYNGVRLEDVARIVREHVVAGRLVADLIRRPDEE